jgi:hypothetical protein
MSTPNMRYAFLLALVCVIPVAVLCCDNDTEIRPPDAGTTTTPTTTTTATTTPPGVDAGPDGARRMSCLDRPTTLSRPSDRLPCELIPPGLTL